MKQPSGERIDIYLSANATTQSLDKGLYIYRHGKYDLLVFDPKEGGLAIFKVQSERGGDQYTVTIRNFQGKKTLTSACTCPYDWGGLCKHRVAALMALSERNLIDEPEPELQYNMLDNDLRLPDLSDQSLRMNTAESTWKNRNISKKVMLFKATNGYSEGRVTLQKEEFTFRFARISPGLVQSTCSCAQLLPDPLCAHKLAALMVLREQFGPLAFESMRDWTEEKNGLLAAYGFSLSDDLEGKFSFRVNEQGRLELNVLDKAIQSPSQLGQWWQRHPSLTTAVSPTFSVPKALEKEEDAAQRVLVYALTKMDQMNLPDLTLVPLTARYQPDKDKLSHLGKLENMYATYGDQSEVPEISQTDSRLLNIAKKSFTTTALIAAVRTTGEQLPRWYYQSITLSELSEPARVAAREHLGQVWALTLPLLRDKITVISSDTQHRVNSLTRVQVLPQPVKPTFQLREEGDFAVLEAFVTLGEDLVPAGKITFLGFWLLQYTDKIAKIADYAAATVLHQLAPTGSVKVKKDFLPNLLAEFVLPLTAQFSVEFNIDKQIDYQPLAFTEGRIYLKEDEENLLLIPMFAYQNPTPEAPDFEFLLDGKKERVTYADDQITVWERLPDREQDFYRFVRELHPEFEQQAGQPFFYLPFGEVMKNQWLFRFFETAKAQAAPVFGFNQLKKFKYNPNRGAIKIRASSGIDWFDMKVEVAFGDQFASLTDVRKAILKKQNYIQLGDGSLGMLPEEWLEQYASLFKFGQVKGDELKVSKLHFSLIDDLYAQIDDEQIQQEILDKKRKLLYFKEIQDVPLPKNITATLRDYQQEGYKWLHFLDEFSWGGCLADDMGLGKTLQVLTFLQEQKNRFPDAVNLVDVPTTLLFNWQAEVDKFAPELRIHLHRGIGRQRNMDFLKTCDIVLTTYGTLRSDIETFKKVRFNYVVLDESQAIKNPDSLTSKAVKLLSAKNRLVMTGTPVENNTFDLYSQMDFLNPGLLGGQEFFRTEFATPIDKHRDEEKARELRKLIYPFLLKRTKEEVAKDLPDKTETILYCEMGKKQRKVYDTFREAYRQRIVDKMAVEGKEKSSFLILEALLKLRQICDSPALLSDDADYGDDSAKLDEIIREIEENASNHKILIFSQFLKMLDLIRQHLNKAGIPYEYLDGSTQDRASRVRNFQEDQQCRVFLMSLKAGGVGINLTEADYVYIVDPWWNPAVEQQAIDRTHRIGQEKKVFAYKMICKDTVEEKILQLQAKKMNIAKDLISTEQGLIKKLTQDDIVGLFS